MKTPANLAEAFAGESQANRRYLAFGEAAAKEGLAQVSRLFRAVAAAETIHAHSHLRALGGVKATLDNLQAAIDGEKHEFEEMYPEFVAAAEAEGDRRAALSMRNAMAVEKVHHGLFSAALDAVKDGHDLPTAAIHVCEVCGHTVIGDAPDRCPICNAKGEKFAAID